MSPETSLVDSHGRTLRDLRISVTDRCNFRCLYCLPETEAAANFFRDRWRHTPSKAIRHSWKPKHEILTFEEIERFTRMAVSCGITKIRLTGGEPLLRQNIANLVSRLSAIEGVKDLAMTTNGFLFPKFAEALKAAGLHRISISLDSFDQDNFKRLTGMAGLDEVLDSVRIAKRLGFHPIKINAVVIRNLNDHEMEALCHYALDEQIAVRFIEFMPLDSTKSWQRDYVVSSSEILDRLRNRFELTPRKPNHSAETAQRWRINGTDAELGLIAPVTQPFCGHCNRLRLTADGQVRTCLFSLREHDFKPFLRGDASDQEMIDGLKAIVAQKEAGHRIGQTDFIQPARTMSCIGG